MNSITRRLHTLLRVAETNVSLVHKECTGELYHDTEAEYLLKQLHRTERELHFALREWERYQQVLIWRAEANVNATRTS